jgi:type I restriction enzyme R subunit
VSDRLTESTIEEAALEWFRELGYGFLPGIQIAPDGLFAERGDFDEVVLTGRLKKALEKINPSIPDDAREEVVRKVLHAEHPSLIENNRAFHDYLVNGVPIEYQVDGETVHDQVWLIDFSDMANNDWLVVNQLTVIEERHNRRPDIVIFVNGLPLAVIELKNPADENATVLDAFKQI